MQPQLGESYSGPPLQELLHLLLTTLADGLLPLVAGVTNLTFPHAWKAYEIRFFASKPGWFRPSDPTYLLTYLRLQIQLLHLPTQLWRALPRGPRFAAEVSDLNFVGATRPQCR